MKPNFNRRQFIVAALAPVAATALVRSGIGQASAAEGVANAEKAAAVDAMKRAVVFMDQKLSYRGGYVWSYLPDLSVTWGEMEAKRTMCWIQPPGTPSVGHSYLDAYHATGDETFYAAAERTALALVEAQHPAGGWNYIHDFAGEDSLRQWYDTIGKSGWRLEEFQHYYGNATFDDATTSVSAQLILRMYLEKRDARFAEPLEKAIRFVLAAQFVGGAADGGWPQRFPRHPNSITQMPLPTERPPWLPADATHGMEDGEYTNHVTFNDDVIGENIKFLLLCVTGLGRTELIRPVRNAMECLRRLQQNGPQAGWGLQHLSRDQGTRKAGAPAGARSYEPRALATHTTQTNIRQLFAYFTLTGNKKYLARVPEAIAWLETCALTPAQIAENPLLTGRTHPTFIELGTNRGRFVHRFGSNARTGAYYYDYDHRDTISHYSAGRAIDLAGLRATYARLTAMTDAEISAMKSRSPLSNSGVRSLPKYFAFRDLDLVDLMLDAPLPPPTVTAEVATKLVTDLGTNDYWLTPLDAITNPYIGEPPSELYAGRAYMSRHVGDLYDTSPYDAKVPPAIEPYVVRERPLGISSAAFVSNLSKLTAYVAS
ncbi:MAG TPA: pectate lyase [Micromonosporaceae bacterium]|nr:pectate lyase [Micromonosporaceae bacterium]